MSRTLCIVALSTMMVLGNTSCNENQKVSGQVQLRSDSVSLELPAGIKPLDDPGNPYTGQYGDWDIWILNNYAGSSKGPNNDYMSSLPEGQVVMVSRLDEASYLVPYEEFTRQQEIALSLGRSQEHAAGLTWVYAVGRMEEPLADATRDAAMAVRSGFYPRIPSWLIELHPPAASLLEDGRVIVWNKAGHGHDDSGPHGTSHSSSSSTFSLYSRDGSLLSETDGYVWWGLFDPQWDAQSLPIANYVQREDGYFILEDMETSEIVAVHDFDGKKLEGTVVPPMRDPHFFHQINGGLLADLYAAQQSVQ